VPNCQEVRELVYDYLDSQLEEPRTLEILGHLKRCRDCFSHLEFEKIMKVLIKKHGASIQPSTEFKNQLHEAIQRMR